jgi:hypothetical protein
MFKTTFPHKVNRQKHSRTESHVATFRYWWEWSSVRRLHYSALSIFRYELEATRASFAFNENMSECVNVFSVLVLVSECVCVCVCVCEREREVFEGLVNKGIEEYLGSISRSSVGSKISLVI